MHILEEKIRQAMAEDRYAVIPFLTAGFPDKDAFWRALGELDSHGADIIEIGVPFSDPVADGPVVESASRQVLSDGITLASILEGLRLRKDYFRAGMVLMGYLNPFLQYGFEKLAKDAREAGVSGVIIPDLPFEIGAMVLTRVVSHPAPGVFTLDLGYKGVAADPAIPRAVIAGYEDAVTLMQNEEHWVLRMPEGREAERPQIGQVLYVAPVHICPTSALYPSILVAKEGKIVAEWPVTARNRRITI